MDDAAAMRRSPPSASQMRESTSARKVDAAPCLVSEPISSLSKAQNTGMEETDFASRKPCIQA